MARQLPLEVVQQMAQQHRRGDASPLLWQEVRPAQSGERISHLPIQPELAQAWVSARTTPFWRHQAQAHATLRRGEPVALTGDLFTTCQTLALLLLDALLLDPAACALVLVPDADAALLHLTELGDLSAALPHPIPVVWLAADTPIREGVRARVLIITPDVLHMRLLRHHDRAWQHCWQRIHYIALAHADAFAGVAAAHLSGLLLRTLRLTPGASLPSLLASLTTSNAEPMLATLSGLAWRVFAAQDTPRPAQARAVWQAGSERLRETAQLALTLVRAGYRVHIICHELERIPVLAHSDRNDEHITAGYYIEPADVYLFAGYPAGSTLVQQALASPCSLCLVVMGNAPHERVLARAPASLPHVSDVRWVGTPNNAYIARQHLLCAATEMPLLLEEVEAWQAEAMITRLERDALLMRLPDTSVAWQPVATADDPYLPFDLATIGTPMVEIYDEYQTFLDLFDPAAFDRWSFPSAALPAIRGGYCVVGRNEEAATLIVRADLQRAKTLPLRNCEVIVRDERNSRLIHGQIAGVGRVIVDETVYGYRATHPGGAPSEQTLTPPLPLRWTAPAVWVNLPLRLKASGQLVGWSLVLAATLRTTGSLLDCVPVYDPSLSRLYLIDAQPGGNGLAVWLFEELEHVLPIAFDIAFECKNDALFEPVARLDRDWLLSLLGGNAESLSGALLAATPERSARSPEEELLRHRLSLPTVFTHTTDVGEAEPVAMPEPPATLELPRRTPRPTENVERLPPSPAMPRQQADPAPVSRHAPPAEREPVEREAVREWHTSNAPIPVPPVEPEPTSPPEPEPAPPATPRRTRSTGRARGRRAEVQAQTPSDSEPSSARSSRKQRNPTPQPEPPAPETELPAPPQPEPSPVADPQAILARLRQHRSESERSEGERSNADPHRLAASSVSGTGEPRFHVGEQITCVPYGSGTVRTSLLVNGHEELEVEFVGHGIIRINPSVSHVRRTAPNASPAAPDGDSQDVPW